MKRNAWKFPYSVEDLSAAANDKLEHHNSRLEWWRNKEKEVMDKIKLEGLEIEESLAANGSWSSISNYARGPTVNIRNDLMRDLQETHSKITEHEGKAKEYSAWVQVLNSQGQVTFNLHHDDWLFFFGK